MGAVRVRPDLPNGAATTTDTTGVPMQQDRPALGIPRAEPGMAVISGGPGTTATWRETATPSDSPTVRFPLRDAGTIDAGALRRTDPAALYRSHRPEAAPATPRLNADLPAALPGAGAPAAPPTAAALPASTGPWLPAAAPSSPAPAPLRHGAVAAEPQAAPLPSAAPPAPAAAAPARPLRLASLEATPRVPAPASIPAEVAAEETAIGLPGVPETGGGTPIGPFPATGPAPAHPSAPAETARHIARQLADHVRTGTDGTTEIRLDPADLGAVRLTLQAEATSVTLVIQADRPETADLMRRHLGELAQEFRALGYDDLRFSFAGSTGGGNGRPEHASRDGAAPPLPDLPPPAPEPRPAAAAAGGLDLRL